MEWKVPLQRPSEGPRDIVGTLHQERGEEGSARVGGAGLELQGCRFCRLVDRFDDDLFFKVSLLGDDQGGEELLGAGDRPFLVRVPLVEDIARGCIDDHHGGALHLGRRGVITGGPQGEWSQPQERCKNPDRSGDDHAG